MQTSRFYASTLALVLLAGAAATSAHAQQKMRPGLWEHSMSMKSQSGQLEAAMAQAQKAMASMPPAQRKQMEQMMAAQGIGISSGPQGQTIKVCIIPPNRPTWTSCLSKTAARKKCSAWTPTP